MSPLPAPPTLSLSCTLPLLLSSPPPPRSLPFPATLHLSLFLFCRLIFSLQLAKDAEQVNKNIKKQCWNVWYEAYLLSSDESSSGTSTGMPATPALSSGARRSSSNFENAPMASAVLNSAALRKSRKVYCYISKKVCVFLWFSGSFQTHTKLSSCSIITSLLIFCLFLATVNQRILYEDYSS